MALFIVWPHKSNVQGHANVQRLLTGQRGSSDRGSGKPNCKRKQVGAPCLVRQASADDSPSGLALELQESTDRRAFAYLV